MQIEEFNISTELSHTIKLIWIPFDTSAEIVGPKTPIANEVNVFQMNVLTQGLKDAEISVNWTISPPVNSSYFINSNNGKQFVIGKNALQSGKIYNLEARVYYASNSWPLWNGNYVVTVNSPPSSTNTTLLINSTSSIPYESVFTLYNRSAWLSSNYPLKYQYFYQTSQSNDTIILSPKVNSSSYKTFLPSSASKVIMRIYDKLDSYSEI